MAVQLLYQRKRVPLGGNFGSPGGNSGKPERGSESPERLREPRRKLRGFEEDPEEPGGNPGGLGGTREDLRASIPRVSGETLRTSGATPGRAGEPGNRVSGGCSGPVVDGLACGSPIAPAAQLAGAIGGFALGRPSEAPASHTCGGLVFLRALSLSERCPGHPAHRARSAPPVNAANEIYVWIIRCCNCAIAQRER